MARDSNTHVPFAKLPFEHRVLFYIQSLSAFAYHCCWPHTSAEIHADLERIWNAEQLTEEDLKDWVRMSELLEARLPKCGWQELRFKRRRTKRRGWRCQ
jgi:hypothetical protein